MPQFHPHLLASWTGGRWTRLPAGPIASVSNDTRAIGAGSLYVALKGDRFDGHDFVEKAAASGAAAALVARPCGDALPQLIVADTRRALMNLAAGYRAALPLRAVAVTGSAGKTTVKEMCADLLSTDAPTARTRGNWNNDIGLPLSLLAADASHQYGVFEVGMNHPGELAPLCAILRPCCSIVTTVGPVHLEYFKSVRGIAEEKAEVFRALPRDGVAVASRDGEWFDVLAASAPGKLLSTSLERSADYTARMEQDGSRRFTVTEASTGDIVGFTASLPGRYIVEDALLAIAAARSFGLGWPGLVDAVRAYRPPPMRWQEQDLAGVRFINDSYNANPLSMRAAIRAFADLPATGRNWLVLAGMLELGLTEQAEHEGVGSFAAQTGGAGLMAIGARGAWIADGAERGGMPPASIVRCADVAEAVAALRGRLAPGDRVLLKASRGERLERVLEAWKAPAGEGGGR